MKIMHLMLSSFYIDNYSYQENLLPKYHKKLGYEVEIVASLFTFAVTGSGLVGGKAHDQGKSTVHKFGNEHDGADNGSI